jgi:hypothetical protein
VVKEMLKMMLNPIAKHARKAERGNMILVMAISLLGFTTIVGLVFSSMGITEVKRLSAVGINDQLYYTAQSGIQEALSTRFKASSNFFNMVDVADYKNLALYPVGQAPLFPFSGRVFRDKPNGGQALIGAYRYMVFGGHMGKNIDNTWLNPKVDYFDMVSVNEVVRQPFFVASKGTICVNENGDLVENAIRFVGNKPTCTTGTTQRDLVIQSQFQLPETADFYSTGTSARKCGLANPPCTVGSTALNNTSDLNFTTRVTGGSTYVNAPVSLVGSASQASTLKFEDEWSKPSTSGSYALPERLFMYQEGTENPATVRDMVAISGTATTLPTRVKGTATVSQLTTKDAIRIFFRGPIDYRSIYGTDDKLCRDASTAWKCNIRVEELKSDGTPNIDVGTGKPKVRIEASMYPLPPNNSCLLIYPPAETTSASSGNFRLVFGKGLRDMWGRELGSDYIINFGSVQEP